MTHTPIFVYGTLLRGEANHHVLHESVPLGPARTEASFELVEFGAYTALVEGAIASWWASSTVDASTLEAPRSARGPPLALPEARSVSKTAEPRKRTSSIGTISAAPSHPGRFFPRVEQDRRPDLHPRARARRAGNRRAPRDAAATRRAMPRVRVPRRAFPPPRPKCLRPLCWWKRHPHRPPSPPP